MSWFRFELLGTIVAIALIGGCTHTMGVVEHKRALMTCVQSGYNYIDGDCIDPRKPLGD